LALGISNANIGALGQQTAALQSGYADALKAAQQQQIEPEHLLKAILEEEADQYSAKGTSHERRVKKEVSNLKMFL
jgi:hypothetical protein